MSIVVSDTSPVRSLANLGLLELLRDIYTEVIVPPAVESELRRPPKGQTDVNLSEFPFVRVQPIKDRSSVELFLNDLDQGESEALVLAKEQRADLILIDEAAGRARAREIGLEIIGVLGVLLEAKHRGLDDSHTPLLDQLQHNFRLRISAQLRANVLRSTGEDF